VKRGERQQGGKHGHRRLGHEHHGAPVERVGGHAADHREDDDRPDPGDADKSERQRAAIVRHEQRHVPQDGRRLHEGADERKKEPSPQKPEVSVPEGNKQAPSRCHRTGGNKKC
jgi:hypothetical protein